MAKSLPGRVSWVSLKPRITTWDALLSRKPAVPRISAIPTLAAVITMGLAAGPLRVMATQSDREYAPSATSMRSPATAAATAFRSAVTVLTRTVRRGAGRSSAGRDGPSWVISSTGTGAPSREEYTTESGSVLARAKW
jgi:hypothetical protein